MAKGFLLVVSGPSGSGKGTVCNELLERNDNVIFSVSTTTRSPREGEEEGVNYFFIDENRHREMVDRNEFLESAYVHGNYYGTPKEFVLDEIDKGRVVLLEIDVQGALQVEKVYPEAVTVFLLPPSMEELENRITKRGTETLESIRLRMKNAYDEIGLLDQYDYMVLNDEVNMAVEKIETIIRAERLKVKRHEDIIEEITK